MDRSAGWYDDPEGDGQRWWTGREWSDRTRTPGRRVEPFQVLGWAAVALFAVQGLFGPQLLAWLSFAFAAAMATWMVR